MDKRKKLKTGRYSVWIRIVALGCAALMVASIIIAALYAA